MQLRGAAGVIASPVLAIETVIENSAYNLQTLRGEAHPFLIMSSHLMWTAAHTTTVMVAQHVA